MRTGVVLALLLLVGTVASAEDVPKPAQPAAPTAVPPTKPAPPLTPEQAADAVLAAIQAKDDAALKALAAKDDPDPWLVADALVGDGKLDAAEAFAKAAKPSKDVERLPAWVASRRGVADDAAARAALKAALAAAAQEDHAAVLAEVAKVATPADDVVGVQLRTVAGMARRVRRAKELWRTFEASANVAERIGWFRGASQSLGLAASEAFERDEFAVSRGLFERGADMSVARGSDSEQVRALRGIALSWARLGDPVKALDAAERSHRLATELRDEALLQHAAATLGTVNYYLRRFDEAERLIEESLRIARRRGDRFNEALYLGNLGAMRTRRGDARGAVPILEKALELKEALGERQEIATTCAQLGSALLSIGDTARAVPLFERSLTIAREIGSRYSEATALGNLGTARRFLGELPGSIEAHARAEALFRSLGDEPSAATQASNLGAALQEAGEYARALDAHERAHRDASRLGDKATMAMARNGLAVVHSLLGDHESAAAGFEWVIARANAIGDREGEAVATSNLGLERSELGDLAGAREATERALRMFRALGRIESIARLESNLGSLAQKEGRTDDAEKLLESALATARSAKAPHVESPVLGSLAVMRASLRQFNAARKDARASVDVARSTGSAYLEVAAMTIEADVLFQAGAHTDAIEAARHAIERMATLVSGVSHDQGGAARGEHAAAFDVGLSAAVALGDVVEASWFLESGRAGALVEALKAAPALVAALPAPLREAESSARRDEAVAAKTHEAVLASGDRARIAAAREALDRAQQERTQVVRRIQREARATAGVLYPRPDALDVVRSRLTSDEVLVVYGLLPEKSVALVVTRDIVRLVSLPGREAVEAAAAALDPSAGEAAWEVPARALRAAVVDPLALPATAKRVLVCPDGAMAFVSFALLLDGRDVAFVPSGTAYGMLLEQQAQRGKRILALADPAYPAQTAGAPRPQPIAMRGGTLRLTPLPATRAEAAAIADVTLLGAEATEAGFVAALGKQPRWRAVHLACHGICDAEHPLRSALAVTPHGDDDGFLSALDLISVRVPADLVVLSACETARGRLSRVEGVYGLSQALLVAGTPRVLSSLWKVDDEATRALMVKFYELWNPKDGKSGLPTATALKQAQEFVRSHEKWKHPYYWAAWVLWGLPS